LQAKLEFGRVEVVVATISTIHACASVAELMINGGVVMAVGAVAVVGTIVLGESSVASKSGSSLAVAVAGHTRVAVTVSVVNASGIVAVEQAGDASVSVVLWVVFVMGLNALLSEFVHDIGIVVIMVIVVVIIAMAVVGAEIVVWAGCNSTMSTVAVSTVEAGATEVVFPPFEGILFLLLLMGQAPALVPFDFFSVVPVASPGATAKELGISLSIAVSSASTTGITAASAGSVAILSVSVTQSRVSWFKLEEICIDNFGACLNWWDTDPEWTLIVVAT
jgi:hypothetical protein